MDWKDVGKTVHIYFSVVKRYRWYAIFSVLFSIMLMCSSCIETNINVISDVRLSDISITNPLDASHMVWLVASFFVVFGLLCLVSENKNRINWGWAVLKFEQNRRNQLCLFVCVFTGLIICWLPYLFSYIPGGIWSDTLHIIRMAKRIDYLTNYHPIAYTVIWRCAIALGTFFGDEVYGAVIYTICQYLFMAVCLAYFCSKLYRWGMRLWAVVMTAMYFAFCPVFPHYAISCWVDTLFGCAVLLYSIAIFEFAHREFRLNLLQGAAFAIMEFMVMFLRNNGIYIVALCSLILLAIVVFSRKIVNKMGLTVVLVVPVIISAILQGPIYEKLGYNVENKVESSGVMFQSVSYVICTDGEISDEDLAFMDKIIPIERLKEIYNPLCIDGVKWDTEFEQEVFDANFGRFFSVFLRTFVKNPRKVIEAWLLETLGFWNIREINGHGFACSDYQNIYPQYDIWEMITGHSLRHALCWRSQVFPYAGFIWLILLAFCKKMQENKKYALALLPSIAGWLTIMIATPIAFHFRYVFFHSLCAPLAVYLLLLPNDVDTHLYSTVKSVFEK